MFDIIIRYLNIENLKKIFAYYLLTNYCRFIQLPFRSPTPSPLLSLNDLGYTW